MPSGTGKAFGLVAAAAAIAGIGYQVMRNPPVLPPAVVTPPANAQYVEEGPAGVIGSVLTGRPGERQRARDYYYGRWIPNPGWEGVVANISRELDRTIVRLHYPAASALQEYWVIAHVPGSTDVNPGDAVLVLGRIAEADGKVILGNVVTTIDLDPALVTKR